MIDFSRNYFELFQLPVAFRVDAGALDRAYRALQSEIHPDRFATAPETERRLAMQSSARVNEAYRALRDPVARASHLLALNGIDADDETDTALDPDFLEQQLERRERASDAADDEDAGALGAILDEVRAQMREREIELAGLFETRDALAHAKARVRELRFLAKVAQDIDAMIAAVED